MNVDVALGHMAPLARYSGEKPLETASVSIGLRDDFHG